MRPLFSNQQVWIELFQAATDFKKLAPWTWMFDDQVFGVQNPATAEIGYCCVLGALGKVFALMVYLGTEGLQVHEDVIHNRITPDEMFLRQRCVAAYFEDRQDLGKPDLELIKTLGLKFRGRGAWPMFRSFVPEYLPWFLTDAEAQYLALALQQAMEMARRCRENPKVLRAPKRHQFLVRVTRPGEDPYVWEDAWLRPRVLIPPKLAPAPLDEVRLQKIRKNLPKKTAAWEVESFHLPCPTGDEGRPYFPRAMLWIDRATGLLLQSQLSSPPDYRRDFLDRFMEVIERRREVPEKVLVGKEDTLALLKPLADKLQIKIRIAKRLRFLEEARDSLLDRFMDF